MAFRELAQTEASAFIDRLAAAAEASAEQVRLAADTELQELRRYADDLRGEAETYRAEAERLGEQVAGLTGQLESLRADGERLRIGLAEQAAQTAREQQAHGELVETLQAQLEAAARDRDSTSVLAQSLDAQLRQAEDEKAVLRRQLDEANRLVDAVQEGMAVMRGRSQRVTALLRGSVKALDALGAAATVADVFSSLVEQLAAEFPRVAIFRVKGRQFEGAAAAGLDASIDVTALVVLTSVGSVITRAAAGVTLEQATPQEIAEGPSPFGGSPAAALAAPLMFQGETLAVLYTESDVPSNDAHAAFAGVLVGHANVLLSRLTQEMKAARELREYAQMLLHEAEEMFLADVQEGRTEPDRLRRLRATIEFGRQLYAQRAALEGPTAAGFLEDEITALVRAEPITPFGSGLAAALANAETQFTAG